MLILRQHCIYRQDLKANPHILYIFGDNLERVGFGGQAAQMRGEPNAFGIATKRKAAHMTDSCYFHDGQLDLEEIIQGEFKRLRETLSENDYSAIVIPLDGIGTGLSKLPKYAPKLLRKINSLLGELKHL